MEEKKEFTLSVFTENSVGMLNRVTIVFTRRKMNIESITASKTELPNIYRYTIVCFSTESLIKKVVGQLEKLIDVYRALYYISEQIIYQEIALYKTPLPSAEKSVVIEKIIHNNNARIISVDKDYMVIEKTGKKEETQELYEILEEYGILEFARSGRVAVTKPMKKLTAFIEELSE
jgi:acetolactate synthase I/III small subunit